MDKKSSYMSRNEYIKEMLEGISGIGMSHGISTVFNDFILMSAFAISNVVDKIHYEDREKEYLRVVKKYSKEELNKLAEINATLINALQYSMYTEDILGELFASLGQSNGFNGQFFTPMHIANMMALLIIDQKCEEIEEKGHITVCEPTCGSGVMVIAAANALLQKGFNPSTTMCVYAIDNDIRCAMMAYIQLSYLGIPAVVIHGDSLLVKEYTRFYTPTYVLNGWVLREKMAITNNHNILGKNTDLLST